MAEPRFHLVGIPLCPYVQRVQIALNEKGIEHRRTDIDLSAPPDWFAAASPTGRVPVLIDRGEPLIESAAILEYLDDAVPRPAIRALNLAQRARERAFVGAASDLIADAYKLGTVPDKAGFEAALGDLHAHLKLFEGALGARSGGAVDGRRGTAGPYFSGGRFGIVDIAAAPAFQRLSWIGAHEARVGDLGPFPLVRAWADALLARPGVTGSLAPDAERAYVAYCAGTFGGRSGQKPGWAVRKAA